MYQQPPTWQQPKDPPQERWQQPFPSQPQPYYPPPSPMMQPPPPRRKRRIWLWIIGIIIVLVVIGSLSNHGSSQPSTTTRTAPASTSSANIPASPSVAVNPLAEHLTFHGDISGVLTTGIDPQPLTHNDPIPNYVQQPDGTFFDPAPLWTQCSDFDTTAGRDYVAVIVGNVGTKRYAVTIEINETDPAYTNPGTELRPGNINSDGSVEVYEMGGINRRWQQVYGPALQDPVIVLHTDRVSGTVDAWMATTDQSQKSAVGTLHIQGNWRCG